MMMKLESPWTAPAQAPPPQHSLPVERLTPINALFSQMSYHTQYSSSAGGGYDRYSAHHGHGGQGYGDNGSNARGGGVSGARSPPPTATSRSSRYSGGSGSAGPGSDIGEVEGGGNARIGGDDRASSSAVPFSYAIDGRRNGTANVGASGDSSTYESENGRAYAHDSRGRPSYPSPLHYQHQQQQSSSSSGNTYAPRYAEHYHRDVRAEEYRSYETSYDGSETRASPVASRRYASPPPPPPSASSAYSQQHIAPVSSNGATASAGAW